MTATNHIVTGALLTSVIASPYIALPVALMSHFVLDVVPHYGNPGLSIASRKFQIILASDIFLYIAFILYIVMLSPDKWLLILAGGVLASSPDLLNIPRWLSALTGRKHKRSRITELLGRIQLYERPWGIYIEVIWLVAMFLTFSTVLK